jgi:hypothetical protein
MKTQTPNILTFCVRDNFNSHDNFVVSFVCEDKTDLLIQLQEFHLSGFESPQDIDNYDLAAKQIHPIITDIQKDMKSYDHLIWMNTNGDKNSSHGARTHFSSNTDLSKVILDSLRIHYGKMPKKLIAANDNHFKTIASVIPTLKVGSKSCFHLNPPKETR